MPTRSAARTRWAGCPRGSYAPRRRRLTGRLPDWEGYLAGSLVEQHRRCGKEGCRCARGELHGPYVYLSVGNARGGRGLVYVPETLARLVCMSQEVLMPDVPEVLFVCVHSAARSQMAAALLVPALSRGVMAEAG